jgi:membrane protease YdiL (CAAX protease family)
MNPGEKNEWSSGSPALTVGQEQGLDAVPAKTATTKLPHPHFGWAILWVFGLWGMQFLVGTIATVGVFAYALLQGKDTFQEQIEMAKHATAVILPIGTFAVVVFALLVALIFYRGEIGRRLAIRPLTLQQWLVALLAVLPFAIIASEVTNCAAEVLPQFNMEMLADFAASPWPLVFFAACLFPALGEEVFCRGFLGRGLVAHHGAVVGVLLASLLFGIMHIDPVQSAGAFTLGLGLHFAYLTTRSLLAPILIHMLNNAFAFLLIRNYESFPIPGLTPAADGSLVHTPPLLLAAAIWAGGCLCGVLYQTRTRWISADATEWSPGYATAEAPSATSLTRAETNHAGVVLTLTTVMAYTALLWALVLTHQSAGS